MRISQSLIDEMVAHAREDLPNECCGMIGGVDGEAKTVYKTENAFASPLRFEIGSEDLNRIYYGEIPERGEELLAIYHSHTKTPAYPSQTDVNLAENSWPEAIWIIISLKEEDSPDVQGYWLQDKKVADAELIVE
jgi:proteasome lid subunit RPN8/RPN11